MSTSDIKYKKRALGYMYVTAFLIFAGFVYELKGHGVYSNYMIYSFIFPFLGMAFWILAQRKCGREFSNYFAFSMASLLASFSIAFIFKGIIDIYGTTSRWVYVFQGLCAVFALNFGAAALAERKG